MTGPNEDPNLPVPVAEALGNIKKGLVRTVVPYAVAAILTGALKIGLELNEAWLEDVVTGLVLVVYYAAVRWLEELRNTKWGWLLGAVGKPRYANKSLRKG